MLLYGEAHLPLAVPEYGAGDPGASHMVTTLRECCWNVCKPANGCEGDDGERSDD